jgi:hypothetical protein
VPRAKTPVYCIQDLAKKICSISPKTEQQLKT